MASAKRWAISIIPLSRKWVKIYMKRLKTQMLRFLKKMIPIIDLRVSDYADQDWLVYIVQSDIDLHCPQISVSCALNAIRRSGCAQINPNLMSLGQIL